MGYLRELSARALAPVAMEAGKDSEGEAAECARPKCPVE